jgi:isoleucyl-tRNA synthetase/bisphosphoglycerate-dependent phosphoglycerate mutase
MFDPVDPRQSFPDLERAILQYWREEDLFRRSIENRNGRESFSFYDGPPFATGLPHYGHLLAGTIKDVIPRYQTMRGKRVERRFGWDCHGLPVENLIEKEHDIKSKQDIEAMGVARFNDLCRTSVLRYAKEWKATVERTGRWVDMDWDYRTMDASYMESIWWVFSQLWEKGLIYEGYKPMHICPRCVTPLSNFEVTQGYKDITDVSAVVMFELTDEPGTYLLAWTTTPWTLPGNLFVAVGPDVSYVKVEHNNNTYIVAEERVESVFKDVEYKVAGKAFKGKKLEGSSYKPLFPYFADDYSDAFRVVTGDFVSTEDGTGLVHIAPGFGEDDFAVGKREGVKMLQHVTMEGLFVPAVTDFAGMHVKPIDDPSKTDRKVVEWLEKNKRLFTSESYRHSYPHCWRCDSPLLNYATSSWFVKVEDIKQKMLASNAQTEWVPAHIRDGRFGNWLENARDWAISRNRYWGTPLPVWRTKDGSSVEVIASRQQLFERCPIRFSKISVVRHGEAEHNVGNYYQSIVPGVDLTPIGKKQAESAGAFLSNQNVTVIYCSPLARTQQTAQAIADATGAQIIVDERLREIDVGEYEGKAIDRSDLTLLALKRQKKLQEGSPDSIYHLEGMEKWPDVQKRIDDFLTDILPRHRSDHVVIVTHGDPIINVRHFFTKEDPFKLSHQPYPNTASPEQYYWDHVTDSPMDLHKEFTDGLSWTLPDSGTGVEATIVRHGETNLNKKEIMQGGNIDEPLNDTGRQQARDLAATLKGQVFDCVITSDLSRTKETAAIICTELGLPEPVVMPLLNERQAGKWTGVPVDQLIAEHPPIVDGVVAFHHETPPDGESLNTFVDRISAAHGELVAQYAGKKVLIVVHRGVMQAFKAVAEGQTYREAASFTPKNTETVSMTLRPRLYRIADVLDCWFESGSMPYAQCNYPFRYEPWAMGKDSTLKADSPQPIGFPADFIAEGIDQTRGWFYTLTVLSSALFDQSPFKHCVVNGIILAEDGRKMSKRLKNYPEPTELLEKHGADALRFALMNSPAVRGEDLRFSEKTVEETLRNVLLPLWNSYSFFVTYANLAHFEPSTLAKTSNNPLDRWILAEVQDLCNRMTKQLDAYDLSATCAELFETIDALTNWYIRLSRRRFAGKGSTDLPEAEPENFEEDRTDALNTLHRALLSVSQVLAPFCPFVTEAIYLNLAGEEHGSIHLTDWPEMRKLTAEEQELIAKNRLLRSIVSLGLKIRSDKKIRVRSPLASVTIAFPPSLLKSPLGEADITLLRQELNVKNVIFADDPGSLGERFVQVDARKAGPRLGKRVQEIIQAGKRGEFEILDDGRIAILDEMFTPDEAAILYRGAEGSDIAAEAGIVVSLDMTVDEALELEGLARDLIRAIQKLRKEQGYNLGEKIAIGVTGADDILKTHTPLIEQETSVTIGDASGTAHKVEIGDSTVTIHLDSKPTHV